jgi:hypothetical protein
MRWRALLGAALLVLLTMPTTGFGWFHSLFGRSSYRAAPPMVVYYYPVPAVVTVPAAVPAAVPAPYVAPPLTPPRLYAEPRPAPPSGSSAEPPRAPEPMPRAGVNTQESRKADDKFYDSYFIAGTMRTPGPDRCAVTFWNLSGKGLTLTVDGQARVLPAGQNVRLDLKRDFAWRVTGRDSERQQVPARETGVEIVIRQ